MWHVEPTSEPRYLDLVGEGSGFEEKEEGPAEIQAPKTQLEAFQTPPFTQPSSLTACYSLEVENSDLRGAREARLSRI